MYEKINIKIKNKNNLLCSININDIFLNSKIDNILFYINRNDNVFFNDTLNFITFCKKNTMHNINYIVFESNKSYNGHIHFLPDNITFETIILDL